MYCTCSNKNNYEVISLCDIKNFTNKNSPLDNKGWSQISVADILILDCNKPSIEDIQKIYVNVSIVSTKIIETPVSPAANAEGMILTGKKLLIDGFICAKIVYTALTKEQSVYSSNFIIPFCTYIVIEANANAFNDKYCVKTCVEDVFLSLIDCKTIFQNVTLFLLAQKASLTCPNPQPPKEDCTVPIIFLQNNIILNAMDNTPVITILFDDTNKQIIVESTGKKTDPNGGADYFQFTLYEPDGTTEKISAIIGGNEEGMNFLNTISKTQFEEGDVVKLKAQSPGKVIITNFIGTGTGSYTLTSPEKTFTVTKSGLRVSYTPPASELDNKIIIKNTDGSTFGSIAFDTANKRFFLSGFQGKYSSGSDDYTVLNFKLYDLNSSRPIDLSLNSISSATGFFNSLSDSSFDYNYVLELGYDEKSKNYINITNFPNPPSIHTPTITREYYKITPAGLVAHNPLPGVISFLRGDSTVVCTFEFDIVNKTLIFTRKLPTQASDAFTLLLKLDNNKSLELEGMDKNPTIYRTPQFDFNNNRSLFEIQGAPQNPVKFTNLSISRQEYIYKPNAAKLLFTNITINGLTNMP